MLADLSKPWKIAIAGSIATVVILATTLGVVLPPARNERVAAAAETSPGTNVGSDTLSSGTSDPPTKPPKVLVCPCFNGEDIDRAVSDVLAKDEMPGLQVDNAGGCQFNKSNEGVIYSLSWDMMGYGVDNSMPDESTCRSQDMVRIITPEEGAVCSSIMETKCMEYAPIFNESPDVPDTPEPVECPCYTFSSIETFMASNTLPMEEGSCAASGDLYIAYSDAMTSEYAEYYRWGVEDYLGELTCSHHDTFLFLKLQSEWDACKAIVVEACAKFMVRN